MLAATNLDLSGIYRHPVFRSHSTVESHTELAATLTAHQLRWGKGEVATALHLRKLQRISLMILSYGAEVEVCPEAFADFTLVQMPLRGRTEIECDGVELTLAPGDVGVLSPRERVRLLWQPGCEQLIVKIPNELLRRSACTTCPLSHCPPRADLCEGWREHAFKLDHRLATQWNALLQQLLLLPSSERDGIAHPAWTGQLEHTVAMFLHAHQPCVLARDNDPDGDAEDADLGSAADRTRLEQVERYIRARLFAPISLEDLARAGGVSARTLNVLCHRHHGVAPMMLLRNLRLEAARERLLSTPGASVTDVALECGFGHLGRFSAYYRSRFGELPSETTLQRH